MDLVQYVHNFLKGPGKAVMARPGGSLVSPGTALTPRSGPPIIDGEWSEVPRGLPSPNGALVRAGGAALGRGMTGPIGAVIAAGDGRPDNSPSDMQALTDAYKQARLAKQAGMPPVQPLDNAQQGMPPVQPLDAAPQRGVNLPWWATGDMTKMFQGAAPSAVPMPQPRPAGAPQAAPSVPMPQPRPDAAPAAQPDTSFFMRNALMMQDPGVGGYIDPVGAASVRGPDLISKMMSYLHNKN